MNRVRDGAEHAAPVVSLDEAALVAFWAAATAAAVLAFVAVGPGHWLGGGLDLESRQLKDEVAYVISNYDTPEAYLFADDTELVARTTLQDESAESVASVVALDNMVDVMALPDQ